MDQALGKVLNPSSVMNSNGKTVFDVLKEKHPDPSTVSENVFIHCNELPPQMEVDITVAMLNLLVENYQKVQVQEIPQLYNGKTSYLDMEHPVRHYEMQLQN